MSCLPIIGLENVFDLSVLYNMDYLNKTSHICMNQRLHLMTNDMVTQTFLFMSYLPLIDLKKWFIFKSIYSNYFISLSIPVLWPFSYYIYQKDLWCLAVAGYNAVSAVLLFIHFIFILLFFVDTLDVS